VTMLLISKERSANEREGKTMLNSIDHIIIGVNDLEQASATFGQRLGLLPSGGGNHPGGGTANRIIVIGDTYLELISLHTRDEAQPSMLQRLAQGDGYLNFVLGSDDCIADSAAMVTRGVQVVGPNAGELRNAAGRSRAWLRSDIERSDMVQQYPFIIQHDSSGEERRFRLAGWTTPPEHPLGVTHVLSTTLAVANLTDATLRFSRIYGLLPTAEYAALDGLDARLAAFKPGDGAQWFELAIPATRWRGNGENHPTFPEPGALSWHLQRFGESLCRITLAVKDLDASRRYLDEQQVAYTYWDAMALWIHADQACGASIVLRASP
jgi:Glyoxalase-like domain